MSQVIADYQKQSLSLRSIKRDWKWCPRCRTPYVNRPMRQCMSCKGVLLWSDIDDGKFAIEKLKGFYVWHVPIFLSPIGWYDMSYWDISYSKN